MSIPSLANGAMTAAHNRSVKYPSRCSKFGICALALAIAAGPALAQTTAAPQKPTPTQPDTKSGDTTTITVTGTKPQNQIDRQTYDNTKNIDSKTGTAADALNKVPSVNVDPNGNVSLRGNSNVQVYVDGKPSAMLSGDNRAAALRAMSSGDIASVEVMTNPGAQFSSEGSGGIINLVTNKNRRPGGSGALTLAAGPGGNYNGAFSGSYHMGKWGYSGGLTYRHDGRDSNSGSVLDQLDSSGHVVASTQQGGLSHFTLDMASLTGGIDYYPGAKDTLSTQLAYSNRDIKLDSDTIYAAYNAANAPVGRYLRNTIVKLPHEDAMLDLNWSHTGDAAGEALKTDLRLSRSDGANLTNDISDYTLPAVSHLKDSQHQSNDLKTGVLSVDYNRFVGPDMLSAGLQITYDDNEFVNTATGPDPVGAADTANTLLTSDFTYQKTVSAAYVTYQKQFGDKWTVLGGLRSETLDLSTDQVTTHTTSHTNYTKLSPSAFATYQLSAKAKLRFSYSHRLQRPSPQDLNPSLIYQDAQNYTAGNPNLKPQETDSFELGYEYTAPTLNYQLRGYYRANDHVITSTSVFIADPQNAGNQVLETTRQNLGTSNAGGVEFNISGRLSPKFTLSANGNLANTQLKTPTVSGTQSATSLSGQAALVYIPSAKDQLQLQYIMSGKQLTGQGYRSAFSVAALAYRHVLTPKASFVLTVSDPFRQAKIRLVTDTAAVHSERVGSQQGQTVYFGLSYALGGPAAARPAPAK